MTRSYQIGELVKKYLKQSKEIKNNTGEKKEEVKKTQTPNTKTKNMEKNLPVKENPLTQRPTKTENEKPEVNQKELHKKLGWFIPLEKINKILSRNPLCIIP